jgi:hypothetical protein
MLKTKRGEVLGTGGPFLTREQAAAFLNLPVSSLEQDRVRGHLQLPVHHFGARVMYHIDDLRAWASARRTVPPGRPAEARP